MLLNCTFLVSLSSHYLFLSDTLCNFIPLNISCIPIRGDTQIYCFRTKYFYAWFHVLKCLLNSPSKIPSFILKPTCPVLTSLAYTFYSFASIANMTCSTLIYLYNNGFHLFSPLMSQCYAQCLTGRKFLKLFSKNCIQFSISNSALELHNSLAFTELHSFATASWNIEYLGLCHSDRLQAGIVFLLFQKKKHCVHCKTTSKQLCPYGDNNPSPDCQRRWRRELNQIIRCEIM